MKNKIILFSIFAIIFVGCQHNEFIKPPLQKIAVAHPDTRTVDYFMEYPGYSQSELKVDLVARVSGFLDSILYNPGDHVREGQVLFIIESQPYRDKVHTSQADVRRSVAQLDYAEASLSRILDASKSNAVSEMDVIKAQTQVDQAKAELKSAKAQLDLAKKDLSYCYVRAPFDGVVSTNLIDKKNYVTPNSNSKLATIYKNDKIFVYFNMEDSRYINFLGKKEFETNKNGGYNIKADVILGDANGRTYHGVIDYIAPNIDLQTGTITMRVVVDHPGDELKDGLFVKVRIPYGSKPDAIIIPEESIGTDQTGRYVYILKNDSITMYRNIEVGVLENDNMREIVSGLSKDDYFVLNGILKVRDGGVIIPEKTEINIKDVANDQVQEISTILDTNDKEPND